ncbi:MAG: phosphoglucosamine mutase [Candidatus ainarchaeum sp.]|nr:phosphoglucosamine mutase [Candidatus ainarchaeum sp.]
MLFGTNGVRGKFNELTPELALMIAQGIGTYFKKNKECKIGVARDARLTGECIENAVLSGLVSVGCKVINLGLISSPTAEFMIKKLSLDGLIIITASHNTPEWNALKVVDSKGISISKERGEKIEKLMEKIKNVEWNEVKSIENYQNSIKEHEKKILEFIDLDKMRNRELKIVLDCGNGTATTIAPVLFRNMGCKVIELNSKIDGNFPGRPSEPTKENVSELIKKVKVEKADAGIAWDGDGDRVIFVDENGGYIIGDKVFALSLIIKIKESKNDLHSRPLSDESDGIKRRGANMCKFGASSSSSSRKYPHRISHKIKKVATTVATSRIIEDICKEYGKEVVYTKVGAPALSEVIANKKADFGGEEVGGVIWPEISLAKDGFFTAAKIVEHISEKKLSEMVSEIPEYYLEKKKIEIKKEMGNVLDKIKKESLREGWKIKDVDGVRIDFEDGWVITRTSGTEPVIRIFSEGKTKKIAEELIKKIEKIIF